MHQDPFEDTDHWIEHFQKMLAAARRTGDLSEEIIALQNLGGFTERTGHYLNAIKFYEECVSVCLASNADYGAAQCLYSLSDLYAYKLGSRETALRYLTRAVDVAPEGQLKQQYSEGLDRARYNMGLPPRQLMPD